MNHIFKCKRNDTVIETVLDESKGKKIVEMIIRNKNNKPGTGFIVKAVDFENWADSLSKELDK